MAIVKLNSGSGKLAAENSASGKLAAQTVNLAAVAEIDCQLVN
ncbi:MAG: hypothetical protein V2I33_21175 [Kangiellaceae bacterium]|jgi:hypothetical protein|nr:hypothetical protein [Kangiellaceae bacterium]